MRVGREREGEKRKGRSSWRSARWKIRDKVRRMSLESEAVHEGKSRQNCLLSFHVAVYFLVARVYGTDEK